MKDKFLVLGCSHSAGIGLAPGEKIYVDILGDYLGMQVENQSVPGSGANECLNQLVRAMKHTPIKFVVAQWPNIFRRTSYHKDKKRLENINCAGKNFLDLLKLSDKNFIMPWLESILCADLLCSKSGVPIYHIYLDELDSQIHQQLSSEGIIVHYDEKLPGRAWLFDNAAMDNMHHSAQCHAAWAKRLVGIINENAA